MPALKCPYLGDAVKIADGENKKETCAPCGGALRQVFACKHHALEPHETRRLHPGYLVLVSIPNGVLLLLLLDLMLVGKPPPHDGGMVHRVDPFLDR